MIQRLLPLFVISLCLSFPLFAQTNGCLQAIVEVNPPTCPGENNAWVMITPTSGIPPYSHNGMGNNPPDSFMDFAFFTDIPEGSFSIPITDSDSCVEEIFFTIIGNPGMWADIQVTNENCQIGGAIDLTIFDGVPPYSYDWSDWAGSNDPEDRTWLVEGSYSVTITDAFLCELVLNDILVLNDCNSGCQPPQVNNIITQPASCGNSSGSIEIIMADDPANFFYNWIPAISTTNIATNLAAGTYQVLIGDLNDPNCNTEIAVTVENLDGPVWNIVSTTPATCGASNGGAVLSPDTYTYNWSDGTGSGAVQSNLVAGTYQVTVTDGTCEDYFEVVIDQVNELEVFPNIHQQPTCNSEIGSVTIEVLNGSGNYTYGNWGTQTRVDLVAGTYSVTVTDLNTGCEAETTFTLLEIIPEATIEITNFPSISCFGENDAEVLYSIIEGPGFMPPAQIVLVDATGQNYNTTNLSAGQYCLLVFDFTGCLAGETCFDVVEPEDLLLEIGSITHSTGNDGSIEVVASGGVAPYTYTWAPMGAGNQANNLPQGIYSVTITDNNNCTASLENIVINSLDINATVNGVGCFGEATGNIDISPIFGSGPYTFLWTGPASYTSTVQNPTGLAAGNYILVVTDANGLTATDTYFVDQNEEMVVSMYYPGVCAGDPIIGNIFVTGGVSQYIFDWGGLDATNLPAGPYSVTVTDAIGCTVIHSDTAVAREPIVVDMDVIHPACGQHNGCLTANVSPGPMSNYVFVWSPGGTGTNEACDLSAGTYSLTVYDVVNGCNVEVQETLEDIAPPEVTVSGSNTVCEEEGFINLQVNGVGPFSFEWFDDPNITSQNRTDLGPGQYTVIVYDANSCADTVSFLIETSIELVVSSTTADCDSTGGTATVIVTGGASNPTYEWSNGATSSANTNLSPGGYSVTVVDPGPGCRSHKNIYVELDSSCFVTISGIVYVEDLNQDCLADTNAVGAGGILITLDSGESTFTNSNGEYSFNVEPGIYTVDLNNNNPQYIGICSESITANVSSPMAVSTDNDFFVEYNIEKDLKIYVSKGNARPGFTQSIQIFVWNYGALPADGTLTFKHDPIQEFLNASPVEETYDLATQTMTWSFIDLAPGAVAIFKPRVKLDPSVPLGTLLNLNFEVTPITGDLAPWNNTVHCPMQVTGSYDPNDKAVYPGIGEEGIIYATDTLLTYRIRFQNTGTDTAFTVVIKDELLPELDIETVVPGPSSHNYDLTIEGERTLVFTFNNIMLPDSFINEPASNGFVFFDVRPSEGTVYGTVIENTAGIYFDFNPPVITNTIVTTFTEYGVGTKEIEDFKVPLLMQPNPTSGDAILTYSIEEPQEVWITIFDLQGRKIAKLQPPTKMEAGAHQAYIPESLLQEGVYLIQVETDHNLRGISRLIKMD